MKPKFILSKSKVFEQLEVMKSLSDEVSYSFKTNSEVARILEGHCYFSVHSLNNLSLIQDKEKVWFFLQGNQNIQTLIDQGVKNFVVDNENDLNNLLTNLKSEINLLLRMRLKEHTLHTGKHFVYGFYSKQINQLIPKLKENKLIKKLGIHFHRKTQNISEWSMKEEIIQSISKENLNQLDFVNIGGGFPAQYKNFRKEVIDSIFNKIKELKEFLNKNNISLIIEPGRFIAAPSIKLETEITNIYNNNIVVNSSVYNSAMDTFVAHIRLLVENEQENSEHKYTIKGNSPCSLDIFRYKVYLKEKPKVGDKVIFLNAGAYNYSSNYFNLEKIETEIVL
jgi:ornithine decarboxylase